MSARNHELTYRPLQGGVLVINLANQRPGTLGAIATRNGTDRFALSCYHVLCRPNGGPFTDGEVIIQSLVTKGGSRVGQILAAESDPGLDVAAARIDPAIPTVGRILGLAPLGQPTAPAVGMRVVKSGAATGVTEGEITRVLGNRVEIRRPTGYDALYELSDFGDSGAIWVEQATGRPVALHTGGAPNADAVAIAIGPVLAAFNLVFL